MEVFDPEGHEIIAEAMKNREYYLALADAEEAWVYGEEPVYNGTLGSVFAFVATLQKEFVVEDENGAIEHKDKRYAISTVPTNKILLSFKQSGTSINDRTIRQYAVVTGVTPENENETFIEAENMNVENMKKLVAENISPKKITLGSQETLSWLLVF